MSGLDGSRARAALEAEAERLQGLPAPFGVDLGEPGGDVQALTTWPSGEEAQARVRAELDAQRARVQRIQASRGELFYSPWGLRGLFPTNKVSFKVKKRKPSKE